MGRIKTRLIKRVSKEIVTEYSDLLKKTFDENKQVLSDKIDVPSKKLRNVIVGYVTRIMKTK